MAIITTKYSVGDIVYYATTDAERKQHSCPDCNGERKWKAISPAGGEYEFQCPRCTSVYSSNDGLSLVYTAHVPRVQKLTVGSVQFNTATGAYDSGARYMCVETGVGSGSIYNEDRLFETEEAAMTAATALAGNTNTTTDWIVKLYDRSLSISDYQLDNATVKTAKDIKLRASSMLWNLEELFGNIEEADDKEAILEHVEAYKTYDWARDKAKCAPGQEAA